MAGSGISFAGLGSGLDTTAIIKQLESSQADVRERCAALWALVTAGDDSVACELLEAAARTGAASA